VTEPAPIPRELDEIGRAIVNGAYRVHTALGPGLLENIYQPCLRHEIGKAGLAVREQVPVPLSYDGLHFEVGYRLDLVVEDAVIVEIKAVEKLLPVHIAQLLTYMKLAGKRLGYLINFNVPMIKDGIKRFAL
jgi:GxxExxY protein